MRIFRYVLLNVLCSSCALLAQKQTSDAASVEALLHKEQHWETKCMDRGCIMSVDLLRSVNGGEPNPNDSNDYVSIAVAEDRTPPSVHMLMFEVDPRAIQANGLMLMFVKTIPDGSSFRLEKDPSGIVHVPFTYCKESVSSCTAVLKGGKLADGTDILARMQSNDHLFLGYSRGDNEYDVAVNLPLFREAYEHMLKVDLPKSPPTASEP